jgi:hypothetical protein
VLPTTPEGVNKCVRGYIGNPLRNCGVGQQQQLPFDEFVREDAQDTLVPSNKFVRGLLVIVSDYVKPIS